MFGIDIYFIDALCEKLILLKNLSFHESIVQLVKDIMVEMNILIKLKIFV